VTADFYDLVILGSGSTAFAAALKAAELGKRAVMTEDRTLGGTCVNRGCLPSKNLIEAAKLLHDAAAPRYPGLAGRRLGVDFAALIGQKDHLIHDYRDKKYQSLVGGETGIEVVTGRARFVSDRAIAVDHRILEGERVIIATGSSPAIPEITGLAETPYLTSDLLTAGEPVELTTLPDSLVIIGGGYIALELGQMFQRFGTQVTVLERGPQLLPHGYEPIVGQVLEDVLTSEGVTVLTHAGVRSVAEEGSGVVVTASIAGADHTIRAERLLVATGRSPNASDIAIERAGVAVDATGAVQVDAYLRTSVSHVLAAGDVIGGQTQSEMATPVGAHDGGIAARNAFAEDGGWPLCAVDRRVIPRVIFTDPQVAVVGLTEAEAIAAGHRCWCATIPMDLIPRANAIRDTRGAIKMVAGADTNEVLGVSMVGVNAGEVIHEAAMGLRFRATLDDYIDLLHVYPTMAEALKIVAVSRYKDPSKLSCCAE
jgi:mercuric reductase